MIIKCQNAGCQSGGSFEVDEKQLEWFGERGMSYPKSCPECRAWKRENQTDEAPTCSVCRRQKRITGRQKIGFHRYKGVWETPSICKDCVLHPERGERLAIKRSGRNTLNDFYKNRGRAPRPKDLLTTPEKVLDLFMPEGVTQVYPVAVLTKAEVYEEIPDRVHGNALDHLVGEKHGSELMNTYGISSRQGVINMLSVVAKSSDPSRVYEFEQNDGRTIKYDRKYRVMMVIIPNRAPPPQDRLLTAYPEDEGSIAKKLINGRWKPQK